MKGFDYPFRWTADEFPKSASDSDLVKASIKQILLTPVGGRVMRPDFGSRLFEMLQENVTPLLLASVRSEVIRALMRWEPRIKLLDVEVTITDSAVNVDLRYRLKGVDEELSLPFDLTGEQA